MQKLGSIAYNKSEGKSPTIVFLSGFKSDMEGAKAVYLEEVARELGYGFVRFDYSGHGKSGGAFREGTISKWRDDALKVIDELTTGDIILVGSSMGGWIMLLAALARPERVKGLIGIAAAPDFTEELMWQVFTPEQKKQIKEQGEFLIPNCYEGEEAYPITLALIEDGRKNLLLSSHPALDAGSGASLHQTPDQVRGVLAINCPVRLIHGMRDEDVPYQTAARIAKKLASDNVEIHLVKNAGHRMSEPVNLELLKSQLVSILNQ